MSLSAMVSAMQSVAAETVEADKQLRQFLSTRDKLNEMRAERNASTLDSLLAGPATGAMMSIYIQIASINPNHPDLIKIKQFMRQFAKVDESFWTTLDQAFKTARRIADRDRRNRGKALDQATVNDILNEFSGRD